MEKSCIISINDVWHTFGEKMVLQDVNLTVNEGDFVAITGPNGGGKTTILRLILHLLKPTKGSVLYFEGGKQVERLKFGYLPQKNAIDSQFPITVEEVIASGLMTSPFRRTTAEDRQLVDDTIKLVRLDEVRSHAIGKLSGGQLQRALLGRAKQFEAHLYQIVETLAATTTIILVSHEMSVISGMANRHIIVAGGKIHECVAHHHFVKSECQ